MRNNTIRKSISIRGNLIVCVLDNLHMARLYANKVKEREKKRVLEIEKERVRQR